MRCYRMFLIHSTENIKQEIFVFSTTEKCHIFNGRYTTHCLPWIVGTVGFFCCSFMSIELNDSIFVLVFVPIPAALICFSNTTLYIPNCLLMKQPVVSSRFSSLFYYNVITNILVVIALLWNTFAYCKVEKYSNLSICSIQYFNRDATNFEIIIV